MLEKKKASRTGGLFPVIRIHMGIKKRSAQTPFGIWAIMKKFV